MKELWESLVEETFDSIEFKRGESIQSLWSGYGEIFRVHLVNCNPSTIVVKHVNPEAHISSHPRGWASDFGNTRKMRSYEIEAHWYRSYSGQCDDQCRVPLCYATYSTERQHLILLEDLDSAGFPVRHQSLDYTKARSCLQWLAHFHALFLHQEPQGLWPTGTYWHLETRPDEYQAMAAGALREHAHTINKMLEDCRYKTLVHGDAKVANFCFSANSEQVAAVDFQYVGGGCGIKDVVYFVGSCLAEDECESLAPQLLDDYFSALNAACPKTVDFLALEQEWREMYPVAWTDFYRFLSGWMPTHQKIHRYTKRLAEETLAQLDKH